MVHKIEKAQGHNKKSTYNALDVSSKLASNIELRGLGGGKENMRLIFGGVILPLVLFISVF